MAEAVPVAHYRVEQCHGGFSMPVIDLRDRRNSGHPPLIRWVYQKHLEIILFRSYGESGAVWKLLHQASLGRTTLACDRAAVNGGVISDAELKAILDTFKQALPADMVDPCSRNKIRSCVLIPLAAASAICRLYGRSEASMSFLRAVNQPIPQLWQMEAEAEANAANLESDLVLLDKIDDHGYEAEEMSFAEELTMEAPFTPTVEDETKLKQYALSPVPSVLKGELDAYIRHRCAVFASKRSGAAVVSATAEHDTQSLLKFYGWMARFNKVPQGQLLLLALLGRREIGDLAQQFAEWLVSNQGVRYSTISNYLSGLIGCMNCVCCPDPPPVLATRPRNTPCAAAQHAINALLDDRSRTAQTCTSPWRRMRTPSRWPSIRSSRWSICATRHPRACTSRRSTSRLVSADGSRGPRCRRRASRRSPPTMRWSTPRTGSASPRSRRRS